MVKSCSQCRFYNRRTKRCKGTGVYVAGWGKVCEDFDE